VKQLVQLQDMYDEFETRNTTVIAVAQEDADLTRHARILQNFRPKPRFEIAADVDREHTQGYHRTSAYLIDREGIVRQIFPMLIHARPDWGAILGEIDALGLGD
jgi:peroxiredoxin